MTEPHSVPPDPSALDAGLAVRRAAREADANLRTMDDRLREIDLHQREARFLLERTGLLLRRRAARAEGRAPGA